MNAITRLPMRVTHLELQRGSDTVVVSANNHGSNIAAPSELKFIMSTNGAPTIGQEIRVEISERE